VMEPDPANSSRGTLFAIAADGQPKKT